MLAELVKSEMEGRLYLSCDEVSFTKHTNQRTDWSRMYSNTDVEQRIAFDSYRTVIASISRENGIDYFEIHESAITVVEFGEYLKNLSKWHGKRPLSLQIDNLSSHRHGDI